MHARAIAHLQDRDPRLSDWIGRIGPIRLPPRRTKDPYRALLQSMVYQQLHAAAARSIWQRFLDGFPEHDPTPAQLLAASDPQLRGAGLSRGKMRAMRAIAASAAAGDIPNATDVLRIPEADLRERLLRIHGVGPWTVDMLLIFTLRRPDVMPLNDYGIAKGFKRAFGKRQHPTAGQLLRHSERWRPHRTTAALYLWRIADQPAP